MSSIDETHSKSTRNQTRIRPSLDDSLDDSILKLCVTPIRSWELRLKITGPRDEGHLDKCKKDTLYKHLKKLYFCDPPRIARKPPVVSKHADWGGRGEVLYVIFENRHLLGLDEKKSIGSTPTILTEEAPEIDTTGPKSRKSLGRIEMQAIDRALEIIEHIDKCSFRGKPKEILAICNEEIAPFILDALYLRRVGYPLTPPWEYTPFYDDPLGLQGQSVPIKKNACSIFILRPSTKILRPAPSNRPKNQRILIVKGRSDQDAFLKPTLGAWQDWIRDVVSAVEKGLPHDEAHRKMGKAEQPGYKLLIAETKRQLQSMIRMQGRRPILWDDWASKHKVTLIESRLGDLEKQKGLE